MTEETTERTIIKNDEEELKVVQETLEFMAEVFKRLQAIVRYRKSKGTLGKVPPLTPMLLLRNFLLKSELEIKDAMYMARYEQDRE
jgi:hypothetical protein